MICERGGGCGGNKPVPHPLFALLLLVGVTSLLVLIQALRTHS